MQEFPACACKRNQTVMASWYLPRPKSPDRVVAKLAKQHILAGLPLKSLDRKHGDCLLVAVTEKRTKDEIDAFAGALAKAVA